MKQLDVSEMMRFVTGALGAYHPMRLTVGLSIGIFLKMGMHSAASSFPHLAALTALNEFGMGLYMVACAPLPFLLLVFGRKGAPEGVGHQINVIRALLDEEGASQAQRNMVWRSVTSKYLAAVQPDLSRGPSLQELFKQSKEEIGPGPEALS